MVAIGRFKELGFTTEDIPGKSASLFESYSDFPDGKLLLRGLEAGPGIEINVVDFDDDQYITSEKKIVISLTGSPPDNGGVDGTADDAITGVTTGGSGISLVSGITGNTLKLKSLVAGDNISITTTSEEITISSDISDNFNNSGSGISIIDNITDGIINFRGFLTGPGISLQVVGQDIKISASPLGSNSGTGIGVYKGQSAGTMQFKSLVAGPGISIIANGNEVTISSNGSGGVSSVQNIGPGLGVYAQTIGGISQFKTVVAGDNTYLTQTSDRIIINSEGEANEGLTVGTPPEGEPVFIGKQAGTGILLFRRILEGNGIFVTDIGNSLKIDAAQPVLINAGTADDGQPIFQTSVFDNNSTKYYLRRIKGETNDVLVSTSGNTVKVGLSNNVARLNSPQQYVGQQTTYANVLEDGFSIAWDLNKSNVAILDFSNNNSYTRTIYSPVNQRFGGVYWLLIKNSAGVNVNWGAAYSWISGNSPVLSSLNNQPTLLNFISDGNTMYGIYYTSINTNIPSPGSVLIGFNEVYASGGANEQFLNIFSNPPLSEDTILVFYNGSLLSKNGWVISGFNLILNDAVNGFSTNPGDRISVQYEYLS